MTTACDKIEQSTLDLTTLPTVDITGQIVYDSGVSESNGTYKMQTYAPIGEKTIYIEVDNSEYQTGAEGKKIYELKTSKDGVYHIQLPTTNKGINARIRVNEFLEYKTRFSSIKDGKPTFWKDRYYYSLNTTINGLQPGTYSYLNEKRHKCIDHKINNEEFKNTLTLYGNIFLAVEDRYLKGTYRAANLLQVNIYAEYYGSDELFRFACETDRNGHYKIGIPLRDQSEGLKSLKITTNPLKDDSFAHYTGTSITTIKGYYYGKTIFEERPMDYLSSTSKNIGNTYIRFSPASTPDKWYNITGWDK